MNKNQKQVKSEEVSELGGKLVQMMNVIQLQNHHLDFIPSLKDIPNKNIVFYYVMVNRSLGTLYEINKDLISDLDDIALRLSEIADELEQ